MGSESPNPAISCQTLPSFISSFVDAFVDFSVSGGLFFPSPNANPNPNTPTLLPSPPRLVAIGDLHGDLTKSLQTLFLAGLLDPSTLRWSAAPSTTAVQVGDVFDRGGDELKLLYLLHRLKLDAALSGGSLITLNGNHEIMNLAADFRYVAPSALSEFRHWALFFAAGIHMKRQCADLPNPPNPFKSVPKSFRGVKPEFWDGFRARIAALSPDGPIAARFLVENQTVVVVGDSVFVHGGITQDHVNYGLERINEEARDWIRGGSKGRVLPPPWHLRGRDSVVWLRRFSEGVNCDCKDLERVLGMIPGARRMVMGHTIQSEGINGVCEDRAIRIDVGISRGCGNGLPEVLDIKDGVNMRIITSNPLYDRHRRYERPVVTDEAKEGLAMLASEGRMKEVEAKA